MPRKPAIRVAFYKPADPRRGRRRSYVATRNGLSLVVYAATLVEARKAAPAVFAAWTAPAPQLVEA